MSALEIVARVVAGVLLVGANAFFVVTEFALTRLRSLDPDEIEGHSGLEKAWEMTDRLEIYLTSCQLGITTTSILMGVVAEPAVSHLIRPSLQALGLPEGSIAVTSVVLAVVAINLIHKIWGEQTPTYLGVERPQVAGFTGPILYYWTQALYPVILFGDGIAKWTLGLFGVTIERSWTEVEDGTEGDLTYAELRREMGDVLSRGKLSGERRQEVLQALEIQRIPVRDVMVPREEIAAFSTERSLAENLDVLRAHPHSRFPLVGESLEDFRGAVYVAALAGHLDELQRGEISLEELAAEPLVVPADCEISRLIDVFQEERQEIALVREETQEGDRIVGLITATDAFETIAGDLEDPLDPQDS